MDRYKGDLFFSVLAVIIVFLLMVIGGVFRPVKGAEFLSCAGGTCLYGETGSASPHIIHVPHRALDDESFARAERWRKRCRPWIVEDKYGVERYHYAPGVEGCEFGKDR